ncbi:DUF2092 domain-containing protein [Auraticoccus sp. F435]|uniref:DUF2092 domain-containing protein n=1 Tax=Auraticoccus cholistanensis TaxID=2656650 RepID=A0A6A9UR82_9ACTN|nr:sigma-E factor regulatory protein RseB domain-containing protein [Auraticoccus cholistanensis]MVA75171.1 DUF2092 domain-containing protein [Auraticoccus cholistanensis]
MRLSRRWIPALVAPVVVAAGAVTVPMVADADPGLPARTPQQVLELVATSTEDSFSGTVEQTSDLGLPDLSGLGGGEDGAGAAVELLTSSHTARVHVDGPERSRVQLLEQMSQRDLVRNGEDVWVYDSSEQTAVHTTLPEHEGHEPAQPEGTPAELAEQLLAGVDETTEVTVSGTDTVAGRPVYQLRLDPRTDATLVDFATLAVDAGTGLPLEVRVHAVGQQAPAFVVGFTELDLDTPDASLFEFTPPPGAEVGEQELPDHDGRDPGELPEGPRPEVSGEGWATVVELPVGGDVAAADKSGMLEQLTRPVEGGRALQTSLVSVLLTDDGRVLAGAVPVEQLAAAAR